MKICECCGREFEPKQMRSKYCSDQCRAKGWYKKHRGGVTKTCKWCGKTFYAERRQQKYCSAECRYQATYDNTKSKMVKKPNQKRKKPDYSPKMCPYCGKEFIPKHGSQKYCCPEHADLQIRRERTLLQNERKRTINETPKKVEKKKPKYVSPASKRWAKMTLTELDRELLYYHIDYGQSQVMAESNTLPEDFGLRKKVK